MKAPYSLQKGADVTGVRYIRLLNDLGEQIAAMTESEWAYMLARPINVITVAPAPEPPRVA